jgi:hypothetical protein
MNSSTVGAAQPFFIRPHSPGAAAPQGRGCLRPLCTIMVYNEPYMASTKQIRRSVTLPSQIDKEIESIARKRRLSGNRVLVELVELGLEARKRKEEAFFALADRFRSTNDPAEVKQLGDELGRFVFGE